MSCIRTQTPSDSEERNQELHPGVLTFHQQIINTPLQTERQRPPLTGQPRLKLGLATLLLHELSVEYPRGRVRASLRPVITCDSAKLAQFYTLP